MSSCVSKFKGCTLAILIDIELLYSYFSRLLTTSTEQLIRKIVFCKARLKNTFPWLLPVLIIIGHSLHNNFPSGRVFQHHSQKLRNFVTLLRKFSSIISQFCSSELFILVTLQIARCEPLIRIQWIIRRS